jgi:hypothetical protein
MHLCCGAAIDKADDHRLRWPKSGGSTNHLSIRSADEGIAAGKYRQRRQGRQLRFAPRQRLSQWRQRRTGPLQPTFKVGKPLMEGGNQPQRVGQPLGNKKQPLLALL